MIAVALILVGLGVIVVVGYLWTRSNTVSREAVTVAEAEVSETIRDAQEELDKKLVVAQADGAKLKEIRKIKDPRRQRDEMAAFANRHRDVDIGTDTTPTGQGE